MMPKKIKKERKWACKFVDKKSTFTFYGGRRKEKKMALSARYSLFVDQPIEFFQQVHRRNDVGNVHGIHILKEKYMMSITLLCLCELLPAPQPRQ
jgi:hypothetical protein